MNTLSSNGSKTRGAYLCPRTSRCRWPQDTTTPFPHRNTPRSLPPRYHILSAIAERGHQRHRPGRCSSDPRSKCRLCRGQPTFSLPRSDPYSACGKKLALRLQQLIPEGIEQRPRLLPHLPSVHLRLVQELLL